MLLLNLLTFYYIFFSTDGVVQQRDVSDHDRGQQHRAGGEPLPQSGLREQPRRDLTGTEEHPDCDASQVSIVWSPT